MEETKILQFIKTETKLDKIQTQEDVEICLAQNKRAKQMIDWAELMRKEAVAPIMASKKALDTLWADREAPLIALITNNKGIISDYLSAQEAIKAKELKDEVGFNNKESKSLASIETKSETGVSYRITYDITVEDIEKVPSKYIVKSVNETLVKEYMKDGKKAIPGLKVVERKIIITR